MSTYMLVKHGLILTGYLILWKSNHFDGIKWEFFQAAAVVILLYSYYAWTKMLGEKAKWDLHKHSACCVDQTLEVAPYKTVVVWLLTFHLANHQR